MTDIATSIGEWFTTGKGLVELVRGVRDTLPKGEQREEFDRKLKAAEQLLARSDSKLAQELGFELCRCTFPPTVMLYRHAENAHVCPSAGCGNRVKVLSAEDFNQTSSGDYDPLSWMGR